MPPKEPDAAPDVFEEWTLDDDILGDTDVLAPARGKRNSLDLDWDELDQLLPESPVNSKGEPPVPLSGIMCPETCLETT